MSVLIKGMKMPEDCLSCPLKEEGFCNITNAYAGGINKRNSDCPLVEFPEHHGDLVDVNEIRWDDHYDSDGNLSKYKIAYSDEMPDPIIKGVEGVVQSNSSEKFKPGDKFILEIGEKHIGFDEYEIVGTDLHVWSSLLEKLPRYEPK